jgi:N-acetylglucosaminyl-diphospho-decaprenol L-rhamnosyltransferase
VHHDRAVVVVSYRSSGLLASHLASLTAQLDDTRCIVVDNFSDEHERRAVATLGSSKGWTVLTSPNVGFGAGVNLAVTHASQLGCTRVLVLNPDVLIAPDDARVLLDRAGDRVVAPRLVRDDGSIWFDGGTLDLATGTARGKGGNDWISGACFAAPVAALAQVGGFDEAYFMYWEDVDLSYRLREAGWALEVMAEVTAVHQVGGSQSHAGSRRKSDLYYRHNCRGRLLFAASNLDQQHRRRWLRRSARFAAEVVLRGGRRQLLHSPGPVVAALRGTFEGVWIMVRGHRR